MDSDPDAILHLHSEIVEDPESNQWDGPGGEKVPVRHRMHRSAVRPFLCCGSELSLVSLVDSLDVDSSASASHATVPAADTSLLTGKVGASCSGCRRVRKRPEKVQQNKSKKRFWSLRGKLGGRFTGTHSRCDSSQVQTNSACSAHRKRVSGVGNKGITAQGLHSNPGHLERMLSGLRVDSNICVPFIDITKVNFDALYPTRDMDEIRREERAREIEEGIELTQQHWTPHMLSTVAGHGPNQRSLVAVPSHRFFPSSLSFPANVSNCTPSSSDYEDSIYGETSVLCLQALAQHLPSVFQSPSQQPQPGPPHPTAHSQVEYIHCLVPDLRQITKCSFYWGVMDRYEAETLLENKPEGTFLLRDSAQEDFLFSVSFRRYNRSLHARIEQWNHLFSFDAHDPAVFACDSVVGLIEHYKDPECCMFFEPMLTLPLNRISCFPLKHLCRSEICSNITYDDINLLPIPSSLKEYLKYYHYKQKVRMKRLDLPC